MLEYSTSSHLSTSLNIIGKFTDFTMKSQSLLPVLLGCLACVSAQQKTGNKFEDYHAQFQASAPLKLNDVTYNELTASPRNFSFVVLLTALEARFGCQLCRDFQPEWDILSISWVKGDKQGASRILYGTLDFMDGKGTFQSVFIPMLHNDL